MSFVSAEPRAARGAPVRAQGYRRHALHGAERTWIQTNCYTDLVVEMLHALGHEPLAMLAYTVAVDFEGDQWTFFKPPTGDLVELYGVDVQELAIWRPVLDHVVEQVSQGRIVMVELDAFHLPDTAGTAYGITHQKTNVGVNEIEPVRGFMGYFHNESYHELEGDEFRRLFDLHGLPPFAELVKALPDFPAPKGEALVQASLATLSREIARAPRENPFPRFRRRLVSDLDTLLGADIERFHKYSFATLRQYGACFELAQSYLAWLGEHGIAGLEVPGAAFGRIAQAAKAFQFQLARAMARGKPLELAPLDDMGAQWDVALTLLRSRYA